MGHQEAAERTVRQPWKMIQLWTCVLRGGLSFTKDPREGLSEVINAFQEVRFEKVEVGKGKAQASKAPPKMREAV